MLSHPNRTSNRNIPIVHQSTNLSILLFLLPLIATLCLQAIWVQSYAFFLDYAIRKVIFRKKGTISVEKGGVKKGNLNNSTFWGAGCISIDPRKTRGRPARDTRKNKSGIAVAES